MDYSRLPYIVALTLLIVIYRPLVRRSGAHVNLWFLGWAFILLNNISRCVTEHAGAAHLVAGTLTAECAGLAFLMAAGNRQRWLVGWGLVSSLAAGPLVQALLFLLPSRSAALLLPATTSLYLLPLAFLITRQRRPSRLLMVVATGFCVFGLVTLAAQGYPLVLRACALLLIYLCAAYLLLRTSLKLDHGILMTSAGLIAWAARYPVLLVVHQRYPELVLHRGLLHLPEVFVLAGSFLSMLEERLNKAERLATHDPLTDLPNRRYLHERFAVALDRARASRTTIACLVIDVDNFKTINDTRGHSAGDDLLRALAVRLGWHISTRDVLARTGGDEFTVMLGGVSNEHYLRFVAEAMMSAACVPVQIDGEAVDVRISMGIALSPDDADEIDDLIRLADEAMYRAKRRGGNVLAFAGDTEAAESDSHRSPAAQILQMTHASRTLAARAMGSDR